MIDRSAPPLPSGSKGCGGVRARIGPGTGGYEGFGVTMPKLVEQLSDSVGRIVIDKTGFTGTFNYQLNFATEDAIGNGLGQPASDPLPSIFTALQEQLGLRLESAKGPVEMIVIDHVERPSEN